MEQRMIILRVKNEQALRRRRRLEERVDKLLAALLVGMSLGLAGLLLAASLYALL